MKVRNTTGAGDAFDAGFGDERADGRAPGRHVANVRNQGAMAELTDDDNVEIAADIDRDRIVPIMAAPLQAPVQGLVCAFKAYEHAAIEAALRGSHAAIWTPARRC
ncbi:hypothetical protein ACFQS6_00965 [Xanthomonas populi]